MEIPTKKSIPQRYKNLFKYITEIEPKSIVEIGVYDGKRGRQMIECAQRMRLGSVIRYYGFDLFELITPEIKLKEQGKQGTPTEAEVRRLLWPTKAEIQLYKGFSKDTLPKFAENVGILADFVFIDGGHSIETIQNDWNWVRTFIHGKTVVLFDDYWHDRLDIGCKFLIDSLFQSEDYLPEILEPIDVFSDKKISFAKVVLA